jgi:methyl-accepting chemotaxis protein
MPKHSTIERQMLTYFGFIAAASLLITVEFVWAVRIIMSGTLLQPPAGGTGPEQIIASLATLQSKAMLMGVVQAVVTLIVLVMLIRRITGPLKHMVDQSRLISEGDLSRTVQISRRDELGLLAETINGLTSNIHEIVAFGLSTDASVRASLAALRARLEDDPESRAQLDQLNDRISGLSGFLEGFQLLPEPSAKPKSGSTR